MKIGIFQLSEMSRGEEGDTSDLNQPSSSSTKGPSFCVSVNKNTFGARPEIHKTDFDSLLRKNPFILGMSL